jgi:hypothetical protein
MAKAIIEIKDEFIFLFSKEPGGRSNSREIPEFVRSFFIKNIANRFQIYDEIIIEKYNQLRYRPSNIDTEPLFLFQIELSYGGKKLGGIVYSPLFSKDSNLKINFLDMVGENKYGFLMKFSIEGMLYWDYTLAAYNQHKKSVENHESNWDQAKIELRLSFRPSFLVTPIFKYDNDGNALLNKPIEVIDGIIKGIPEDESNLGFMLEIMPQIHSRINSFSPESDFDKNNIHYQMLSNKNIHMKCKYLSF